MKDIRKNLYDNSLIIVAMQRQDVSQMNIIQIENECFELDQLIRYDYELFNTYYRALTEYVFDCALAQYSFTHENVRQYVYCFDYLSYLQDRCIETECTFERNITALCALFEQFVQILHNMLDE